MPYSDNWNVAPLMSWVRAIDPATVLDVGVGFGKNGVLVRETLELSRERYKKSDWRVRVEGVEIFPEYRNALWDFAYDRVHIASIEEVLPALGRFDLALFCDVIEHFEKKDGARILQSLLDHAEIVIVSTPYIFAPQGNTFGNEAEIHRSYFSPRDFRGLHSHSITAGACYLIAASRRPLPMNLLKAPSSLLRARLRFVKNVTSRRLHIFAHKNLPPGIKERIRPLREALRAVRSWADQ